MSSILLNLRCRLGTIFPGLAARLNYLRRLHRWPSLRHPQTLNEKIQWLKFNGDNKAIAPLADKYAVRSFVESRGLGAILVPLLGKWDSVEDFRKAWPSLPAPFVLKTNNSCKTIIIVKDKVSADLDAVCSMLGKWLSDRTTWGMFVEPHYKYIEPCIIAETFLEEEGPAARLSSSLIDYKIWCFNGRTECLWVCANRSEEGLDMSCYDTGWNEHPERLVYSSHFRKPEKSLPRPEGLEKMLECASILSKGFPQVRVDFYCIGGKVYFGEMTFTSNGGCMPYFTDEYQHELGSLCELT
ncbi:MAG: glycosyltransferase [Bacteroidales bacterium]|nr:glycosyltransferase [Bacteroidales bacterium]